MTNTLAYYTTIGNCDKFYFTLEFKVQMWVQIYQIFKRDLLTFSIRSQFCFGAIRIRPNSLWQTEYRSYLHHSISHLGKVFYNKGTSSHTNVVQPYLIPFFRFCLSKIAFVNKAQFRTKRVMSSLSIFRWDGCQFNNM